MSLPVVASPTDVLIMNAQLIRVLHYLSFFGTSSGRLRAFQSSNEPS
jgi:hypothetical protein